MAERYFIKRGEKSKGPFSLSQLQTFLKAQQLKSADMLSIGPDGPWVGIASVFKEIKQGIAPALPDPLWEVCDSEPGQEEKGEESDPEIVFGEYTESAPDAVPNHNDPEVKKAVNPREREMTDCPICARRIATSCEVCPGCGHMIQREAREKEVRQAEIAAAGIKRELEHYADGSDIETTLLTSVYVGFAMVAFAVFSICILPVMLIWMVYAWSDEYESRTFDTLLGLWFLPSVGFQLLLAVGYIGARHFTNTFAVRAATRLCRRLWSALHSFAFLSALLERTEDNVFNRVAKKREK
jgi:hypothetical protein